MLHPKEEKNSGLEYSTNQSIHTMSTSSNSSSRTPSKTTFDDSPYFSSQSSKIHPSDSLSHEFTLPPTRLKGNSFSKSVSAPYENNSYDEDLINQLAIIGDLDWAKKEKWKDLAANRAVNYPPVLNNLSLLKLDQNKTNIRFFARDLFKRAIEGEEKADLSEYLISACVAEYLINDNGYIRYYFNNRPSLKQQYPPNAIKKLDHFMNLYHFQQENDKQNSSPLTQMSLLCPPQSTQKVKPEKLKPLPKSRCCPVF